MSITTYQRCTACLSNGGYKETQDYKNILEQSEKQSAERIRLKRETTDAKTNYREGKKLAELLDHTKQDYYQLFWWQQELVDDFRSGRLWNKMCKANEEYNVFYDQHQFSTTCYIAK